MSLAERTPQIDQKGIQRLPFPAEIAVETHAFCNLRCCICPYESMRREKGVMSEALFHKIVDQVAVESPQTRIWPAIMGEPCIDKHILDHCQYAVSHGAPRIHLNSNGVFLEGEVAEGLIGIGIEAIYVAIDAATETTYNRVRPGGDFQRVVRNVQHLLKLREKTGTKQPEISVQLVVMDENAHEVDQFSEFWHDQGAVVKLRLRQGWGTRLEHPDLAKSAIERFPCPWLLRTMNVHWTGKVTQCDVDYEENYPAGDLNTMSIKQVWTGPLAERRERHWQSDFSHPLCKDCMDWAAGRAHFFYPNQQAQQQAPRYSLDLHD